MAAHSVVAALLLLVSARVGLCGADQVCYDYVGCFNNSYPFNDIRNNFLPESPNKIGTVFLLYTRRSDGEYLSYYNSTALRKSAFNPSLPSKFITHGFTDSETSPWMHDMKDALLAEGDFNVIIVGWKNGARAPDYPKAVANTRVVGEQLALLIRLMMDDGAKPNEVHLIGHSLGAHISGFAGTSLRGIVGRISGLDPAGPSFKNENEATRLDPTDAVFVDAIHTNGAPIINGGAGIWQSVAHVDFYPNGGRRQPGCPDLVSGGVGALISSGLNGVEKVAGCSHDRSIDLYTESIRSKNCRFLSVGCPGDYESFLSGACSSCSSIGCSEMGYNSNKFPARGKMFLMTRGASNYCGYPGFVKIRSANSGVVGELTLLVHTDETNVSIPVLNRKQSIPDSGITSAVLFPTPLNMVVAVEMMYSKFEGRLFGMGSGLNSWSLSSLFIQDPINGGKSYCHTGNVESDQIVRLQPC